MPSTAVQQSNVSQRESHSIQTLQQKAIEAAPRPSLSQSLPKGNEDLYDASPPPRTHARPVSPSPEPNCTVHVMEFTDQWIRRSTRPKAPPTSAADMTSWEEIDSEGYDFET